MKNMITSVLKNLLILLLCLAGFAQAHGQGEVEWQNTIGGSADDYMASIQQTTDGGYILGGYSNSGISGDKTENSQGGYDYWVVKTSASGAIEWQNTIGGSGDDVLSSIRQTTDGGYILGGSSDSNISGDKNQNSKGLNDYWVVKLNAAGNILWQKTIGGSSQDECFALQLTTDGGFILGGRSASGISGNKTENSQGEYDYWAIKLNASGNIIWQNTIGGNLEDGLNALQQTSDGGYILGGNSRSNISGDKTENSWYSDYWVVKLDASGIIQWQNTISGGSSEWIRAIQQTTDGGYIINGFAFGSVIAGDKTVYGEGAWVIKIDANGSIQWQTMAGNASAAIELTPDGGCIVGGSYNDYEVRKLDIYSNIKWQNTIGGSNGENLYDLKRTADGGFILGGSSDSNISGDKSENSQGARDFWAVKLSATCPALPLSFKYNKACGTTSTGSIIVKKPTAAGYSYLWSTGDTTKNLANVAAGTYSVTVTKNATGCTLATYGLLLGSTPTLNVGISPTNVLCKTAATGSALAIASGGVNPKVYTWSNGVHTTSITNLTAGIYTVTVNSGTCVATNSANITEPPTVLTLGHAISGSSGGPFTVTLTGAGGTNPYRYCKVAAGACTFGNNNIFGGLLPSTAYEFRVRDGNFCITTITVTTPALTGSADDRDLQGNPGENLPYSSNFDPKGGIQLRQNQPNPFSSETTIAFYLPEPMDATLSVFDLTGKTVFQKTAAFPKGENMVTLGEKDLPCTGLLTYRLETAAGCPARRMLRVE